MSYAVRKDKQGFRAVNGPEDIGEDEFYSEEVPSLTLDKSFEQALSELEEDYQKRVDVKIKDYLVAFLEEGTPETKQKSIKEEYLELKNIHQTAIENLKKQYKFKK